MWGKTRKGARNEGISNLCSLYFSVVKNKLYLHPGGGRVWRALCEAGAGGHLSTAPLPSPAPQTWGRRDMALPGGPASLQLLRQVHGVDHLTTPYEVGSNPGEVSR